MTRTLWDRVVATFEIRRKIIDSAERYDLSTPTASDKIKGQISSLMGRKNGEKKGISSCYRGKIGL